MELAEQQSIRADVIFEKIIRSDVCDLHVLVCLWIAKIIRSGEYEEMFFFGNPCGMGKSL
jgi:hypothetical protein